MTAPVANTQEGKEKVEEKKPQPRQAPYRDHTRILYDCLCILAREPRSQTRLMVDANLSYTKAQDVTAKLLECDLVYVIVMAEGFEKLAVNARGRCFIETANTLYGLLVPPEDSQDEDVGQ